MLNARTYFQRGKALGEHSSHSAPRSNLRGRLSVLDCSPTCLTSFYFSARSDLRFNGLVVIHFSFFVLPGQPSPDLPIFDPAFWVVIRFTVKVRIRRAFHCIRSAMSATLLPARMKNGLDPLRLRGRDWQALPPTSRERVLETCFSYWRSHGFPYDQVNDESIRQDMLGLSRSNSGRIWGQTSLYGSTAGLRSVNFFHPLMWSVRSRNAYSPIDRFQCDHSLRRILRHALKIWPDKFSVNATNLRSMLRTFSRTTRVSNFRPTLAKAIIEQFSDAGQTVLDFSSGYSGRLLGSVVAQRPYIGIDPSFDQIQGGWSLVNALRRLGASNVDALLCQGPAEEVLKSFPKASAQLIFSSPPYFDRERYSEEPSQSYVRYPQYSDWKKRFLEVTLLESARILRKGGYLALNVCNVERYSIADDAFEIASSVLRPIGRHSLCLARKPYLGEVKLQFKHEPLFVFRK